MALEHAILVSLAERASSGYDLARRFDKSIGQFWSATHQQVYKVLARMESSGWVAGTLVPQEGRPDKKVYELTAEGRDELARWISEPAEPEVARSDLAVKIRGVSYGDADAVIAEIGRHRALHLERLEYYLANEKHEFPDPSRLSGHRLHQYLVLRGGINLERNLIDWYDEVLVALQNSGRRKGKHPKGTR
jgi:DNA-binding PadR family transcriptional regulator